MTLEKRTDKSSPTPIGDKIPKKETKEQSDIANEIINLAKNIKISGTEVSISFLIPLADRQSEKGKKVNKESPEKCTAENFAFILLT